VPAVITAARAAGLRIGIDLADVLGPVPGTGSTGLLVEGLIRRLPTVDLDAVVLAAAGTRDAAARGTVADVAAALGRRLGVPGLAAYASAAAPTPGAAVSALRAAGLERVGMAAYFVAPGLLHDVAVESAVSAGAVFAGPPLGDAPELVELVAGRVEAAESRLIAA
jgi:sirohydrochlorin ferrochelatase